MDQFLRFQDRLERDSITTAPGWGNWPPDTVGSLTMGGAGSPALVQGGSREET